MTVKVNITTPPGHTVMAQIIDVSEGPNGLPNTTCTSEVIPPDTSRDIYIYQGRSLALIELNPEAAEALLAPTTSA